MIALSPRELRQRRRVGRHHERTCEMGQDRDEERTTEARIDRLRERLKAVPWSTHAERQLRDVMQGMLDLLADELLGEARK